ncbi:MAG: YihY/virulence factor BrkB family protein [Caldimicrobium sp.]|nr:YihY/virulence factor BrkB family protein [Caldimicrobium sp.]MCX7873061.1 YihY/virulence factor BrkB family protein [Caldimicrobium sp.]MDW8094814.1 YihY/virulence factor BrkB family protein [Caldimicrobium sp.]
MKTIKESIYGVNQIIRSFCQKLSKDEVLLYAQSLTYNSLLTIIPLLGVVISLSRVLLPEHYLIQQSFQLLVRYFTPEALISIMETIIKILDNLKKFPLGQFSLIVYFLMSLGLLLQIEDALNRIFVTPKKRTLKERILLYWITLTLSPFILLLPLLIQTSLKLGTKYHLPLYFGFLLLFFFLVYIYFPARKINKSSALKGAILTTLLWYLFSLLFSIYVKKAVAYSKIYGSFSVVPLFFIYLFLNWLNFLIGAEITYFLERKPWKKHFIDLSSPLRDLLVLLCLTKNFYSSKVNSLNNLYGTLPFPEEILLETLKNLERKGIILLKEEEIFFHRPPENINLREILNFTNKDALRKVCQKIGLSPSFEIFDRSFQEKTLKDLLLE